MPTDNNLPPIASTEGKLQVLVAANSLGDLKHRQWPVTHLAGSAATGWANEMEGKGPIIG